MAFGGVAIGKMNAKEQAMVTGMASTRGLMFILTQAIIKIGKNTEAVEVFDVKPVMNEINKEMEKGKSPG